MAILVHLGPGRLITPPPIPPPTGDLVVSNFPASFQARQGVHESFSFTPYVSSPAGFNIRATLEAGTLPSGWTLDQTGLRLMYSGFGNPVVSNCTFGFSVLENPLIWTITDENVYGHSTLYVAGAGDAHLTWQNQTVGDFDGILATGIQVFTLAPQNVAQYANQTTLATVAETPISLDATWLVMMWFDNADALTCFHLRKTTGGDIVFYSLQEDVAKAPKLQLTRVDGTVETLTCTADGSLQAGNSGVYIGQGANPLRTVDRLLIQFDRPTVVKKEIQDARLILTPKSSVTNQTIQTFAASVRAINNANWSAPDTSGFASAFIKDAGIAAHSDVLIAQDFTSPTWNTDQTWRVSIGPPSVARHPCDDLPGVPWMLKITIGPGVGSGGSVFINGPHKYLSHLTDKLGNSPPEDLWVRYYFRLNDFVAELSDSGKLGMCLRGLIETDATVNFPENTYFGKSPTPRANGSSGTGFGTLGWSTRTHFTKPTSNPKSGHARRVSLAGYVYDGDTPLDGTHYNFALNNQDICVLTPGIWHMAEYHIKMNNVSGARDGIFKFWLNNRLVMDRTNVFWRAEQSTWQVEHMGFHAIWVGLEHGGPNQVTNLVHSIDYAKLVIAFEKIGPMG